jgi:hypothetical protein
MVKKQRCVFGYEFAGALDSQINGDRRMAKIATTTIVVVNFCPEPCQLFLFSPFFPQKDCQYSK